MDKIRTVVYKVAVLALLIPVLACSGSPPGDSEPQITDQIEKVVTRDEKIPENAVKVLPETDDHPPVLFSNSFKIPVPLPGEVNTAGAEDSPYVSPDGDTLYFFFTPDVNVPVEKQIQDGVTGIYVSKLINDQWGTPERVLLQEPGKLAMDGCAFILSDRMWFCTVREGFTGLHWFTAERRDGEWLNWRPADFNPAYQVGELHITSDGTELYFASDREGGAGNLDIWVSQKVNGEWQVPENVIAVNTADNEGWPAIHPDGSELWFSRGYGIWRSKQVNGEWSEPELIVSTLAGEPSIDEDGNLYFVHHYFVDDTMLEADIYVAYKK